MFPSAIWDMFLWTDDSTSYQDGAAMIYFINKKQYAAFYVSN